MQTKEELINRLIRDNRYESYLEIGSQSGYCYDQIECDFKKGVDPAPVKIVKNQFIGTSDQFFECNKLTFDIVFIDGLHHDYQVLFDLINAASSLRANGRILLHDMMPKSELTQRVPRASVEWYGSSWKVGYLIYDKYDLKLTLHDFDCGILEVQLGKDSVDDMLCDYIGNLDKLKQIDYDKHFMEYLDLFGND